MKKFYSVFISTLANLFVVAPVFARGKQRLDPVTPNIHSFAEFVMQALRIVVQIGIPITAILLIWAGYLFVTAQGDVAKLTQAKRAFLWTVIGAAVVIGCWLLATAIQNTIEQIAG